jgi:sugar phosphate isomerase/epimerase
MARFISRRDILKASVLAVAGSASTAAWGGQVHKVPARFHLGIITDEISQDFSAALDFISSYSLHFCELREFWKKNIMNATQDDLKRAKDLIAKHNLRVTDIASPLFKYNLPEMPALEEKRDTFRANFTDQDTESLLHKSFELAELFGTKKVRIFSYWRVKEPEKAYSAVRDRLAKAAETAARSGFILALENEQTCNIATGKELGRLLHEVNAPELRANWDPANAVKLGEVPYPDGYRHVEGYIAHLHIKDIRKNPSTGELDWAPVGSGVVDWEGQIKALLDAHYPGAMSLETHYRRPDGNTVESTRESLEGLIKVLAKV